MHIIQEFHGMSIKVIRLIMQLMYNSQVVWQVIKHFILIKKTLLLMIFVPK